MAGKVEESQDYTRPTMIYKCQVANYLKSEIEVVNNLTHFPTKINNLSGGRRLFFSLPTIKTSHREEF